MQLQNKQQVDKKNVLAVYLKIDFHHVYTAQNSIPHFYFSDYIYDSVHWQSKFNSVHVPACLAVTNKLQKIYITFITNDSNNGHIY